MGEVLVDSFGEPCKQKRVVSVGDVINYIKCSDLCSCMHDGCTYDLIEDMLYEAVDLCRYTEPDQVDSLLYHGYGETGMWDNEEILENGYHTLLMETIHDASTRLRLLLIDKGILSDKGDRCVLYNYTKGDLIWVIVN